jgi:hypothetical protein
MIDLPGFLGGDGNHRVAELALQQPQSSIEIRAAQVNRTAGSGTIWSFVAAVYDGRLLIQ